MTTFLEDAGRWFLESGIRTPEGGVARFYRSDLASNVPVSSEITGYTVSALSYLHALTGDATYRDAALSSARFLVNDAWDAKAHTFPFEPRSDKAYFFDIGIIVRGLVATGSDEFRERAKKAALSLAFDFLGDGSFHPIIALPDKQPLPYQPRWSQTPGCFQLKAALAWLAMDDEQARRMFDVALAFSLATHESFLDDPDPERVMDRLHAYCYFLEALLYVASREECRAALAWGIARVSSLLREISPRFERSDVCAQLLRVRLIAHHLNAAALDEALARDEASRIAKYQSRDADPRLKGGFWFGKKGNEFLPYMNPVSTAFCLQALTLWVQHQRGAWSLDLGLMI